MAKFNHTAHKELWDWLTKNPDRDTYAKELSVYE